MALPKPEEILKKNKTKLLPTPDEVLSRGNQRKLPTPEDVFKTTQSTTNQPTLQHYTPQLADAMRQSGMVTAPVQTEPALTPAQGIVNAMEERARTMPAPSPNQPPKSIPRDRSKEGAITEWFRDTIGMESIPVRSGARGLFGENAVTSAIDRFGQAGARMAGADRGFREDLRPTPATTGSRAADTALDVAGSIGGVLVNPLGPTSPVAGQASIVGQIYNNPAVQRAASSGASRISNPLGRRMAEEAIREGVTGAAEAATMAFIRGEDPGEIAKQTALGGALGGVIGGAVPAVGQGLQRALRRGETTPEVTPQTNLTTTQQSSMQAPRANRRVVSLRDLQQPTQSRNRGFVNTLEQSENLSNEVRQGLSQSPARTYEPITNRGTVAAANQRIARGIDEAEAYVMNGTKADAEQVATGMRLIQELQNAGQTQRAVTLAENLAEKLTKAGQTVQAASIWNRLTPEGALIAAQRKVAKINRESTRFEKPVELTEKNANDIMTAAGAIQRAGASQERAAQVMDIADRIKKGDAISTEEQEIISEFVKDLQSFVKPARPPRPPRIPKEMNEPRIRDRVVQFMDEQEKAAKERLRSRGIRISSTPVDVWADYAIIGASKLAKGAKSFADWSEHMVRELGNEIRPHLAKIYDRAQEVLSQNSKTISERAVSRAEKIADNYLRKNEGNISPEDAEFIRSMARNVSELSGDMQKAASMDLQAVMNQFEKVGIGRKLSAAQYISMLLNPVTQIRNISGNELMYRLERINRLIATPVDIVRSAATGRPREITFKKGPTLWENFFAPTRDYFKGLIIGGRAGWRGVNPEGLTTSYDLDGQAFRSKLNPLTYLEKTLGAVMKGFDYAAYNRAVNQRLREMAYLDAVNNGVRGQNNIRAHMDRYIANLDDNISTIAKEYGRYITLQDDTVLSKAALGTRRILNLYKDFGAGSIVLPFAKTPANLLMRAFEFSPAGFFRAIYQASEILRRPNTDLTRADVIQSATRALLGSGLTGVGLWLADKGVLRGDSPGDTDVRNLERQTGLGQFQLNGSALQRMLGSLVTGNMRNVDEAAKIRPGDVLWQYEWAQPSSIPLAVGANISQERKGESQTGFVASTASAAFGGMNTLFNTSLLQGLQEAFEFPPGEDNKVQAFLLNLAKSAPSMFTPSMMNRIAQYMDEAQRETYTNDLTDYIQNSIQARTPVLSRELPQRVDTLGQPMTRQNSFFDVFLSPSQRSVFKPSEEAKLVMDLLTETGDERVAPRTVPRYITGTDRRTGESRRVDLTPEQFVRYQRIVGEETARRLSRINPNIRTEAKIKRVLDALDKAGEKGRKEMKKELGLRP